MLTFYGGDATAQPAAAEFRRVAGHLGDQELDVWAAA